MTFGRFPLRRASATSSAKDRATTTSIGNGSNSDVTADRVRRRNGTHLLIRGHQDAPMKLGNRHYGNRAGFRKNTQWAIALLGHKNGCVEQTSLRGRGGH